MNKSSDKRSHIIWFNLYEKALMDKFIDIENKLVAAYGLGWRVDRMVIVKGYGVSFWGYKII